MLTLTKLAGCLLAGLAIGPAAALAQVPSTDPGVGSPAGTIYELPLDAARGDAAPKRPAPSSRAGTPEGRDIGPAGADEGGSPGTGEGGNAGTGEGEASAPPSSALRSENGFGSSAVVPGADGGGGSDSGGGSGGENEGAGTSSGSDGTGATQSSPAASQPQSTAAQVGSSEPSSLLTYGLLALVIAAGIAGGVVTRMRRRPPE